MISMIPKPACYSTKLALTHHHIEHHHQHETDGKANSAEIGMLTAGGFGYQFLDHDVEHGSCSEGNTIVLCGILLL